MPEHSPSDEAGSRRRHRRPRQPAAAADASWADLFGVGDEWSPVAGGQPGDQRSVPQHSGPHGRRAAPATAGISLGPAVAPPEPESPVAGAVEQVEHLDLRDPEPPFAPVAGPGPGWGPLPPSGGTEPPGRAPGVLTRAVPEAQERENSLPDVADFAPWVRYDPEPSRERTPRTAPPPAPSPGPAGVTEPRPFAGPAPFVEPVALSGPPDVADRAAFFEPATFAEPVDLAEPVGFVEPVRAVEAAPARFDTLEFGVERFAATPAPPAPPGAVPPWPETGGQQTVQVRRRRLRQPLPRFDDEPEPAPQAEPAPAAEYAPEPGDDPGPDATSEHADDAGYQPYPDTDRDAVADHALEPGYQPLPPHGPAIDLPVPALPEPPPGTGRAGRNLPMAVAVGGALAGAVLASLLVRKELFIVLVAGCILVGVWEMTTALAARRLDVPVIPLFVGSVGMLVSASVVGADGLLISFVLTAFGVVLWRLVDGVHNALGDVAAGVFTAGYVPFLAGFAILLLGPPDGASRVIVYILLTVSSDIGGYAAGVLFGRRPMAPSVSPKKTWEGLAGSVATGMVAGGVSVALLLHGAWWAGLATGAAAVLAATLGDLAESLVKRDLGLKDMGTVLPGHGGMMDRLDSLLVTAPVVYVLLTALVPVG